MLRVCIENCFMFLYEKFHQIIFRYAHYIFIVNIFVLSSIYSSGILDDVYYVCNLYVMKKSFFTCDIIKMHLKFCWIFRLQNRNSGHNIVQIFYNKCDFYFLASQIHFINNFFKLVIYNTWIARSHYIERWTILITQVVCTSW